MTDYSLADARNRFSELVADVESTHARVTVTKHGHPAAVIISPEDLASLEETLEILSESSTMQRLADSEAELAAGVGETEADLETAMRARRPHPA